MTLIRWTFHQPAAVLRFREDDYSGKPPGAEDALLLIEVSDSSLAYDREVKANLYAQANIPETWIMNLVDDLHRVLHRPGSRWIRQPRHLPAGRPYFPVNTA